MCGIVGYVGLESAAPILLEGLKRLEYRGYDSAGIVIARDGKLSLTKTSGYVANLVAATDEGKNMPGTIGLGHTRWATHGQPTNENAHPHISSDNKIAVVHNGIIENYRKLRDFLLTKGFQFASETDTEVAVNLIAHFYAECGDLKHSVAQAARRMEGSYALGILCEDCPDTLIAVKKHSPLFIGSNEGEQFLSSDIAATLQYTRDIYRLRDDELAVLTRAGVEFFTSELDPITKTTEHIEWDISAAEKGGHAHFMIKEILEQPDAVRNAISPRIRDKRVILDDLDISDEYIRNISRIYLLGCGTAYYVGAVGKYNIEKLTRIPTEAVMASEFRYAAPILDEHTLCICFSQSGTTTDTIAAMEEAKRRGAKVLAVVNVVGSQIAEDADWTLYTNAGPEMCVASTKAYSTQLAVSYIIALRLAEARGTISAAEYAEIIAELQALPSKLEAVVENCERIQYLSSRYFNRDNIYFTGRNVDYATSLEASLKLKEISYIASEAYTSGEFKHGPIALIENGTLLVALATYNPLIDKTVSNALEVKSRGAELLAVTTESGREALDGIADELLTIPDTHTILIPSLSIVPLQLFAYYIALALGREIDKPRNLAKSVTVE